MSRAWDAKHTVLKYYKSYCDEAKDLFLSYLDISEDDFEYEFNDTVEEYLYGEKNNDPR